MVRYKLWGLKRLKGKDNFEYIRQGGLLVLFKDIPITNCLSCLEKMYS